MLASTVHIEELVHCVN